MTTVMLLLASAGVATPLTILGDRLSVFFDADTFLALMGRVGGYNRMKQLGVLSVIVGQLALGGLGGVAYAFVPRARRRLFSVAVFVVLPLVVAAAVLWPVLGTHYGGLPITRATLLTLLGLLVTFLVFERTLVLSFNGLTDRPAHVPIDAEYSPPIGRRALILSGLGLLLAGGGIAVLRKLYRAATFSYDGLQYGGDIVQAITPNESFYCVTKNVIDPVVNASHWRLEVTGLIEKSRVYNLDQLTRLPSITQETTLMCISNNIDAGLMSNAVWKGVPMRAFIEAAGLKAGAARVKMHGVDNYTDTIPLEKALEPSTLIVYEMNGVPLPPKHGFPARAIVPGWFGEKHVKWITRLELTDATAKGFYETQGWGPDFIIPTRSRIDVPYDYAFVDAVSAASGIRVRGVAFGGDRGVSRVELSTDNGETWADVRIDYPGTRLTWALWSYDWKPPRPETYTLVVRATDADGNLQAFNPARPFKSGPTGFHKITVYVG
ncbi:MAG TPA: molybdopterin-dependent oxidoreductase [Chthoniobacterales bacterium]|nr:molybdopterin-dependent oxidoreductase [Chthoniobacterales bacterium]